MTYDQVDVTNLAGAELVARTIQWIKEKHKFKLASWVLETGVKAVLFVFLCMCFGVGVGTADTSSRERNIFPLPELHVKRVPASMMPGASLRTRASRPSISLRGVLIQKNISEKGLVVLSAVYFVSSLMLSVTHTVLTVTAVPEGGFRGFARLPVL